jgi:hypothetical protein
VDVLKDEARIAGSWAPEQRKGIIKKATTPDQSVNNKAAGFLNCVVII